MRRWSPCHAPMVALRRPGKRLLATVDVHEDEGEEGEQDENCDPQPIDPSGSLAVVVGAGVGGGDLVAAVDVHLIVAPWEHARHHRQPVLALAALDHHVAADAVLARRGRGLQRAVVYVAVAADGVVAARAVAAAVLEAAVGGAARRGPASGTLRPSAVALARDVGPEGVLNEWGGRGVADGQERGRAGDREQHRHDHGHLAGGGAHPHGLAAPEEIGMLRAGEVLLEGELRRLVGRHLRCLHEAVDPALRLR
mmetsp:Transcript_21871/g.61977  ORF Transcript_21871/g.61977 Transcript_21871/m.61977 type:complete len:253 (-) Transcript_21871:29-787(-)